MIECCSDLERCIHSAAEHAIRRCAQGLLTVDTVVRQTREEWEALPHEHHEDQPSQQLLNRLALRICSRTVYQACCSTHVETRECAFENLHRYLEQSLYRTKYYQPLTEQGDAAQDVVQETLNIVQTACMRYPPTGPRDPAAFLKWSLTILIRQASTFLAKNQQEPTVSLDAQFATLTGQLEAQCDYNPEALFDSRELQQVLEHAILSLSNLRYRQVLLGTFLLELEDRELAVLMGIQVQQVYLSRFRALQALRSKREVVDALQPWLQQC